MNVKVILILILLLGFLLRILDIDNNPPSLYGDELTIVYDAFSLLKTGQDQLGNPHPLTFPMGAGRSAGYVYGSMPFVAIFGPSALGVRMLSILSGVGIILLLYLLGKKLFEEKVGLAAGFITAVSPWDISLSRGGFEAHFALFLSLLGIYLLLSAKQKPILYIFSAISFGLTIHTYPTYKLILPLFLPLLLWFEGDIRKLWNSKVKFYVLTSVAIFALFMVLSVDQTLTGGSESRFFNINIFSNEEIKAKIEQKINFERSISTLPQGLLRTFHNKGVEYTKVLIENYLQNFSLDFLVIHGDGHPRHNMATMGQIFLVQFILFFVGLVSFWTKYKKILIMSLFWLALAPIPTAIVDVPHALRSSFMLPPLVIISTLGLTTLINQKNKIYLIAVLVIFVVQFIFFAQKLYLLAPNEYSRFWSYPAKEASEIAIEQADQYDFIILSDQIDSVEFAYPVYAKVDPKEVISQNKQRFDLGEWQFKKLGNIYIGYIAESETEQFIDSLDGSVLYIGSPKMSNFLKNYETISDKDGSQSLVLKRK